MALSLYPDDGAATPADAVALYAFIVVVSFRMFLRETERNITNTSNVLPDRVERRKH